MKKTSLLILLLATFFIGYAFRSITTKDFDKPGKRVNSIGGIFFKCKDPKKLKEWYNIHLGLQTNQYGTVFEWRQASDSTKKGFTQWSAFSEKTNYFTPTQDFMINYRVEDLEWLVRELKAEGVTITDTMEVADYGKFIHILDLEGNKIELWEPNDIVYEKIGQEMNMKTTK